MKLPAFGPHRLLLRITALFALAFGVGAAGNALYTAREQADEALNLLERSALAETRAIAAGLAADIEYDRDALVALRPRLPDTAALMAAALVTPSGEVLSALRRTDDGVWRTAETRPTDAPPPGLIGRARAAAEDDAGRQIIVSWVPLVAGGRTAWLRTETDTPEAREMHAHILHDSLLHGLFALLLGASALYLLLRRPLAALNQCTDFAERLDHAMGETLPTATGSHETDRLAQALNWASLSLYDQRSALAESEARTGAILGAALDAVITFDGFGNVIEYNPAAEGMLGWPAAEAMQHPVIELLVAPDEREPDQHDLLQWLGRHFEAVIGHHMELDIRHRSGRRFPAQLAITSTHMKGRALFTAFISDISERRAVQEQMMQARDAAEAASRAKSDFLANMSHEIRTPMNAIMGMTELALDTDLTGEQREYLTLVKQSSDTLLTLIDDILDFSKIEAGHLDFEHIPFSLREVIGSIVRTLAPKPGRPVQLGCRIDPSVTDGVVGDPVRLRQVLTNLIGNALKFTERGSVDLSVTLDSQDEGVQGLRFAVRDTGIGIPAHKQALIFDAFSQADSSTTRRFGGTGLGLAICTRLVKRMGGRLEVISAPREGSTFHFTVPLTSARAGELASQETGSLERMPLLVIEPDPASRTQLAAQLAQWQMAARVCADLDEGIGAIVAAESEAQCFRALLVAEDLAARDGWALVHALKGQCAAELPIILLHDGEAPKASGLPAGISGLVARPAQTAALLDALMAATGTGTTGERRSIPVTQGGEGRRLNILLAEDNPVNQTLAVRLLERLGHEVDVAANGLEAVAKADCIRYDVILMDLQMPQMGGFDATRHIRAQDGERHTPIVAMTAHAMAGDREKCFAAGMDAYVSKPIQVPALIRALEEALQKPASAPVEHREESIGKADDTHATQFDRAFTLGNLGGDEVLMRDIIVLFLRDYRTMLGALREARSVSRDALSVEAHTIKGTVRNFGGTRAAGIAGRLERRGATAPDDADTDLLINQLETEVEALAAELRAELQAARAAA
ncbi:response regulator [Methyloversatilis discipulorum]|uniref:response regulator n=1 Tax=Methyloversatilis discipulorum TaxID=1119528 RepID=UPI001A55C647|nr:response regulator [Methyloversatilis discipulorum]MBL8466206.1 response regulator [Methyloversatilis discipulorum]